MPLIRLEDIQAQHDEGSSWSGAKVARAQSLLDGVLDWISQHAPCLDQLDANAPRMAQARMIVSEAILRAVDSTGNIGSEDIGPSHVNYIDRAALPTLTRADEDQLKALCPKSRRQRYGTIRTRTGY